MDTAKKKGLKIPIIIGAVVAVAAIAIAVVAIVLTQHKGYRQIMIYQVNGSATLDRENVGEMDAYENLAMRAKDVLSVQKRSSVRLQMDEDKYALAEENTVLSITAEGKGENTYTDIDLQQGAVTIEIQNKLSEGSTYQVTTPNSVMAVRGTVFRVAIAMDEEGKPKTKLDIFEGSVAVKKVRVNEKGERIVEEKEIITEKGQEIVVVTTSTEEGEDEPEIIIMEEPDYEDVPSDTFEFLQEVAENSGRELTLSVEEIIELKAIAIEREEEEIRLEELEALGIEITDEESAVPEEVLPEGEISEETTEETTEETAEPAEETAEEIAAADPKPVITEEPVTPEPVVEEEEEDTDCEVRFLYQGQEFAKRTVEKGTVIAKPKLQPAESGKWDYDFSREITEDTDITFIAD